MSDENQINNVIEYNSIDMGAVMDAMDRIAEQLPDVLKNTSTIGEITNRSIPEDGLNIAETIRTVLDSKASTLGLANNPLVQNIIERVKTMSDDDIIETFKNELIDKGLSGLANNITDGNLSRSDLIQGFSEYGYMIHGREDTPENPALLDQVRDTITNTLPDAADDAALLEGLVLAEHHSDALVLRAMEASAVLKNGLSGEFDDKAAPSQEPLTNANDAVLDNGDILNMGTPENPDNRINPVF